METLEEEADMRREAAIASSASLRPNFNPKTVSQTQLSKFQELHKRRLQIKAKSSKLHKKKTKDKLKKEDTQCEESKLPVGDSFIDKSSLNGIGDSSSTCQHNVHEKAVAKQRTKLYWGLDTRERWERKSNM